MTSSIITGDGWSYKFLYIQMDTRLSLGKPAKAVRCKLVAGPRQATTVQGGKKISEQVMVGELHFI